MELFNALALKVGHVSGVRERIFEGKLKMREFRKAISAAIFTIVAAASFPEAAPASPPRWSVRAR